ncbi:hypothetical protein [Novosphingobium sp. SG707]|uniref:hypothetical protein n=1 Tax=Novosphingobium sp. SG707 TaxID=2586996 RepID=UPI001447F391|nr:hypothetical protein [Novosphingobium sp. SG707]NKJ00235.1 hypothetical protein [Novosphingobium sp. SG707]
MLKKLGVTVAMIAAIAATSAAQAKDLRPAAINMKPIVATPAADAPAAVGRRVAKRSNLFGLSGGMTALAIGGAVATGALIAVAASSGSSSPS